MFLFAVGGGPEMFEEIVRPPGDAGGLDSLLWTGGLERDLGVPERDLQGIKCRGQILGLILEMRQTVYETDDTLYETQIQPQ